MDKKNSVKTQNYQAGAIKRYVKKELKDLFENMIYGNPDSINRDWKINGIIEIAGYKMDTIGLNELDKSVFIENILQLFLMIDAMAFEAGELYQGWTYDNFFEDVFNKIDNYKLTHRA
ncbi:hypothetical protein B8A44_07480 [Dolosigranulum pigrum]|uniref:Uncharacterized protein n=1 Tax=Dolosigranulum pigrum TaxID=29394 RepID=A0A328KMM0_9LACT|nr:hypothetical protein [Dolosigranulum pigrum]RAN62380.1 hypothetical protein B8A44_07480 [Dolosigranulum pigrum]